MTAQIDQSGWMLTEKEKQTLRLIVRGHDAKSTARSLGLSVHTINERLRDARRKMAVSSSREAARLLLAAEGGDLREPIPETRGDTPIGEDASATGMDQEAAPVGGAGRRLRLSFLIGALLMTLTLGLLAFALLPQAPAVPTNPAVMGETPDAAVVDAARQFLTLVDQERWDDSYRVTGEAFRKLNTAAIWAAASRRVRVPLGAMTSRVFVSQENLPAPPSGYEVVKFRTSFANKADALETVTLDREDGGWRVVGVTIG